MMVLDTPEAMRTWSREQRAAGKTIGLVPTMGALHEGHLSLIRASVAECDVTVASIFVNPTQFGPNEDLEAYPRTFDSDKSKCEELGIDAIYAPKPDSMYPQGYATYVEVERVSDHLCGASRPVFFRGVATVVAKLFNVVEPDRAYFGQKDAQQCAVIRRMVHDLDFGIEIVEMPIVREPDGLAMSSRNAYLSDNERSVALNISKALFAAREQLDAGERNAQTIRELITAGLAGLTIDYVEVVDADDIQPVDRIYGPVFIAVGAWLGKTRLIDNIAFTP
jgi:pantoate--beta-alanine ligase